MSDPLSKAAILDQIAESVIATDLSGRITYWNRGATRIFGYSADEMLGRTPALLYPSQDPPEGRVQAPPRDGPQYARRAEGDPEALRRDLDVVLSGQEYTGEWIGRHKDGRELIVAVRTSLLHDDDGAPCGFVGTAMDVTARQRAIEAKLRWEAGYRLVMLASNEAIWDWDLVSGRLDWNEGIHTSFGWRTEHVGLDIEWWNERLHPSDLARVTAGIEAAFASDACTWTDEYRFLRADGRWADVHDQGYIQRVDGRAVRMVGTMRDVTAARRRSRIDAFLSSASALLASSQDYERTLAALAPRAVPTIADWCAVDVRGADGAFERLCLAHADPEDAPIAEVLRRYPPIDRTHEESLRSFVAGEPLVASRLGELSIGEEARGPEDLEALRAAGFTSWLAVPIVVGGGVLGVLTFAEARSGRTLDERDLEWARELGLRCSSAVALARSVRERDELVARLRESQERQRLAVEAASIGTWDMQLETDEVTWDDRAHALFGLSPGERVDYGVFLRAVHPDDRPRVDGLVHAALDPSGDGRCDADFRAVGIDDGVERMLRIRGRTIFDNGRAVRCLGIVQDVGELQRKEAELRSAMTRAEEANRAKDAFLAMLGHELRNPLAPMLTALQLMAMRDPQAFPREREILERQIGHMVRLVDDLLDVSRIIRGNIELRRERVELADVMAEAIETASALLERREHNLVVRVPRGLILDGDRDRLRQVFSNLLTNAAKYTDPGGHLEVVAERRDGSAAVRVIDDGRGIQPELLPRIFQPFAQGWRPIDRAEGGLGLGLTIVQSFVALHGGTVSVSSPGPGRGSTFEVRLPLCAVAEEPVPASPEQREAAQGIGRVLVVDDNEDAAELLAASLDRLGWSTRVANDGPSALDAAHAFRPDIAVLDIGLPVMDGYELARRMRDEDAARHLVAVTGYGQPSDRERAREAGFDRHFVKPVSVSALHRVLRDWVEPGAQA